MATFEVKPVTTDDCTILAQILKKHMQLDDSIEQTERSIRQNVVEKPTLMCLLARDKTTSAVIGVVSANRSYSTWEGRACSLDTLYVLEEHRRKGVATRLFAELLKLCMKEDVQRLDCPIQDDKDVMAFLHAQGAVDITEREGWHYYALDQLHMAKLAAASDKEFKS